MRHSKWTNARAILSTSKTALLWGMSTLKPSSITIIFSSPEGATKTAQIAGNQYVATYTPIHTVFWRRTAILGMVIALLAPSYAMFCFMPLSLLGIFSRVIQTDIRVQQAGHPEGKTVMNAFLLQILAFIVIITRFSAI